MTTKTRFAAVAVAVLVLPLLAAAGEPTGLQETTWTSPDQVFQDSTLPPGALVVRGQSADGWSQTALRFGWWGISTDGSQRKIGEWQDVESSPFWDVDRLFSNGVMSYDVSATGTDNETTDVGLRLYTPTIAARVDYQRYLHRVDHYNWQSWRQDVTQPPYNQDDQFIVNDLDQGVENTIRVQELDIRLKGDLSENIRWRLNLWGMRKHGQREASAVAHCEPGGVAVAGGAIPACHAVSQQQTIDWLTMEIEPVLEANFGRVSVQYSRPMRSFTQSDELVTRDYSPTIGLAGFSGTDVPYAVVPENFSQVDKLRIRARLTDYTEAYAYLYNGGTKNKSLSFSRYINGWDLRLINRSIDGLSLTGYYKRDNQRTQVLPPNPHDEVAALRLSPGQIFRLVNRDLTRAGVKARWRPFRDRYDSIWRGLSLGAGYEYRILERDYTEWHEGFAQPDTKSNILTLRTDMNWNAQFDSFIRYRMAIHSDPLYGVDGIFTDPLAGPVPYQAARSSLPEQEDLIEFGGTWMPADNFVCTATIGIEARRASATGSPIINNFDEDNYPMTFTVWYSPTERWNVSGGLAYLSNWIDQDITLGRDNDPNSRFYQYTFPWSYGGRAQVVNFGSTYQLTDRLTLLLQLEWTQSRDFFERFPDPSTNVLADWSNVRYYSDVRIETTRLAFGLDYAFNECLSCYFRYNWFDYEDQSQNIDPEIDDVSGTAHMFLVGVSALY